MKKSLRPRSTAKLSEPLNRQLNLYALSASGTAFGLLALGQPAEARIIYTKTHLVVHNGTTSPGRRWGRMGSRLNRLAWVI